VDVDGLKTVNDLQGHEMGDLLIKRAADAMKSALRAVDSVARIGGDEFAVIIPQCDLAIMEQACQRLRGNMDKQNELHSELPISFSVGWSVGNLQVKSNIPEIIKQADQSMYTDKEKKRSQYLHDFKEWLSYKGKNVLAATPAIE